MNNNNKNVKTIQSVERSLTILEQFTFSEKEIGLSELARRTGLKRTTCYGLAETLHIRGYLDFNRENSKYRLGIKTFELGQIYSESLDLTRIAKPFLSELSGKYRQVVHLVVPDGFDAVYIDKVGESNSFRVRSSIGSTAKRFCTGVSKIVNAALSDDELEQALSLSINKYTENTIIEKDAYMDEIRKVRENGYAIDMEELEQGLACIAAPLTNYNKKTVGAISISGPTQLIGKYMENIVHDVRETAKQISKQLGG